MRKPTRFWGLLLSATLLASSIPAASAADPSPLRLYVNGRELFMPSPVVIRDGRTLVPMRAYLESLGATVQWQPPDQVTAQLENRSVHMTIGSTTALVDGQEVKLDVPAQLIDDRTYLPLRFLSEGLGAGVDYDGKSVSVRINGPQRIQVIDGPLNVRQSPSLTAPVVITVPNGTTFEWVNQQGTWSQVRLPKGQLGWVATQYTRRVMAGPLVSPFQSDLSRAEGFLQIGNRCLGATPVISDRLHVPLRQTVAALGGSVTQTGTSARVQLNGRTLILTPGETAASIDGAVVQIEPAPTVVGGQILISARALSDQFHLGLTWNDQLRVATLGPTPGALVCNPQSPVQAYAIMDAETGLILAEYRSRQQTAVASITKIMTALLGVELADANTTVTVSPRAASQIGTSVYLRTGEQRTMRELLLGLMLVSGNDAASAIAEHLGGSEPAFARTMTDRAIALGARQTLFLNGSGLDDWVNPYSTARDMALITQYALQNPEFRVYVSQSEARIPGPSGTRLLTNKNDFVLKYAGATGVKNGWTEKANHTLVASAYRNNRELIVVVLGAPTRTTLYDQAMKLMDQGFALADQAWLLKPDR